MKILSDLEYAQKKRDEERMNCLQESTYFNQDFEVIKSKLEESKSNPAQDVLEHLRTFQNILDKIKENTKQLDPEAIYLIDTIEDKFKSIFGKIK